MPLRFRNLRRVAPRDVQDGDAFAIKIVAVAGTNNDWAAYIGPSGWSDRTVAAAGDKLLPAQALPLFYVLRESGREYRG